MQSNNPHFPAIIRALREGMVVPFLGAGVNLCNRPPDEVWAPNQSEFLPSGAELTAHLANAYTAPLETRSDLMRVAQYADDVMGSGYLYKDIRKVVYSKFNAKFPPTSAHMFLATLPALLRQRNPSPPRDPLRRQFTVVTTNYDDVLERAFDAVRQPYHVISYIALGEQKGRFLHRAPPLGEERRGEETLIEQPNAYDGLLHDDTPVIVKLHGAIDLQRPERDSFVITEEHYIDYLTRSDLATLLPLPLPTRMTRSSLLFLGYGLRDWNLRVILHRIWTQANRTQENQRFKSWAVQQAPPTSDRLFWSSRNVDILDVDLKEYIGHLDRGLRQ